MGCSFGTEERCIRKFYTIGDKLGAGAFGQVRECKLIGTNDVRAVKIIWKDEQGVTLEELMQEIDCMRCMTHHYIVRLYDFFQDEKFLYCVMDKFTGKELFAKLKQDDLRESHFAKYVKMMLSAVQYISQVKVVHRDIKPENFLFKTDDPDGDLCMIDFGLSQIIDDDEYLSVCCGTVQYLSPEQIKGRYRFEVDMWAVGVITYLLLFGRFPYSGGGDTAIMHEIIHKELVLRHTPTKKDNQQHSKISKEAKYFVSCLLDKNPATRISPTAALQHSWIVMDHEDFVIDKDTIRMAHAVALSSRREADPALKHFRDALIDEAGVVDKSSAKRSSIMSSVTSAVKSMRWSTLDDNPQQLLAGGGVHPSANLLGLVPKLGGDQQNHLGSIPTDEVVPAPKSKVSRIRSSIISLVGSMSAPSPTSPVFKTRMSQVKRLSQVKPAEGTPIEAAAALYLEQRRQSNANDRLEALAAENFRRRPRSLGTTELADQISKVHEDLEKKMGAQTLKTLFSDSSVRSIPQEMRENCRSSKRSFSMSETWTESRERIDRQGESVRVINEYLPDTLRCQDPGILKTINQVEARRTSGRETVTVDSPIEIPSQVTSEVEAVAHVPSRISTSSRLPEEPITPMLGRTSSSREIGSTPIKAPLRRTASDMLETELEETRKTQSLRRVVARISAPGKRVSSFVRNAGKIKNRVTIDVSEFSQSRSTRRNHDSAALLFRNSELNCDSSVIKEEGSPLDRSPRGALNRCSSWN